MPAATGTSAALGFESKLWDAADLLRSNMDPAEYKHVVLGLLFLKYISDAFEERRADLAAKVADPESEYYVEGEAGQQTELGFLIDDRDEYAAGGVFWVPPEARWAKIRAAAPTPEIGKVVDDAMTAIERENPTLRGVLPTIYARPGLDKESLGKLIDLFSNLGIGGRAQRERDVLGRAYEYFLARFASAEGKGGGEFYTPQSVVRLLVEMLEPYGGRVLDPCCGSGGMFVQSLKFLQEHGGQKDAVSVYGQEYNRTTWRLARMNLAIRGITAHLGPKHADSLREDLHPDLRADFVLANPPFNVSQWHGEALREDHRWRYGTPPVGNANFAWVQHFLSHLSADGTAGFVMANGSLSSMSGGEGDIRRAIVEADRVDCIVALPTQLFYTTGIPVCLWFLTNDKTPRERGGDLADLRDRQGETLFIDARSVGEMEDRTHRVLTDADLDRITDTYHGWRNAGGEYQDEAGFSKSASLDEILAHDAVLTPGRYVGVEEQEGDGEPFEEKMARLADTLRQQMEEARLLDAQIGSVLSELNYGE